MKIREAKRDVWGGPQKFYGRYKNFKVEITNYGSGKWYVLMDSKNMTFNSLWEDSKFDSKEEARIYAIEWIDFATRGDSK